MLINGTPENDVLNGTPENDEINGLEGDDVLDGGVGGDTVDGGVGTDVLIVNYAALGTPSSGIYSTITGDGSGYLYTYSNNSRFDQVVYSNIEQLNVTGTAYNDSISTGNGSDIVTAGGGNDSISTGNGNDIIQAGVGDDFISAGIGNNIIDGGLGVDTLSDADFSATTASLSFKDDGTPNIAITLATGDSVSNVEYFTNLTTGSGNDKIIFTNRQDNTLRTGAGNDTINAGVGGDTVDGGVGTDVLIVNYAALGTPSSGIYSTITGDGSGYLYTYSNNSRFDQVVYSNIEQLNVTGTAYNDSISTGNGSDIVTAGGGNDSISTGNGNDVLLGGNGNDQLLGGAGGDQFVFDTNAVFSSNIGVDTISDFVQGSDKIVLDKTTFIAITSLGAVLNLNEFAAIEQANDGDLAAGASDAIIVFNKATGDLFYNADGVTAGLGNGGLIAKLTGISSLTAADIGVRT